MTDSETENTGSENTDEPNETPPRDVVNQAFAALGMFWGRFQEDRCLRVAASLSYTSLLALVPFIAITFAMLAAFPVFEGMREQVQSFVFENFVPEAGHVAGKYLDTFLDNAGKMTAVGIIGLAVTAIMLLGTIEGAFNIIFRVRRPRRLVPRLLVFWAIVTLGPLLLGASLSLSTYFYAASEWVGADMFQGVGGWLTKTLPTVMVMAGLTVFYLVIPNRPVRFVHALIGGVIGGLLFSFLRSGFGAFMSVSTTYQTLYGAMAIVPVFLIWMYLTWSVVLLGGVITAVLGERFNFVLGQGAGLKVRRIELAVTLLKVLHERAKRGGAMPFAELVREANADSGAVEMILEELFKAGFVESNEDSAWVMARDPSSATLYDVYQALGHTQDTENIDHEVERFTEIVVAAETARRDVLSKTLAYVLEKPTAASDDKVRSIKP